MIYERIRKLCDQNGETITGLEKELGFARGSLSKIDKNKPSSARVSAIAEHFSVSINYILYGEYEEKESESGKKYYFSDETAELAQELFDSPETRMLFDAAKNSSPENLRLAAEMLKRFKETNPDG